MMRIAAIIVAILISLSVETRAADTFSNQALDEEIARFLTALEFGEEAKLMYAKVISGGELDSKTAQALAQVSERRFVELAVPAFRSLVSLQEAKEMADFYNSDAMRQMLAEQKHSGGNAPPTATNQAQAAAVETFMRSQAGQAALRVQRAMSEPEFAEKLNDALEQELQKE
jgi:hypothetical protein